MNKKFWSVTADMTKAQYAKWLLKQPNWMIKIVLSEWRIKDEPQKRISQDLLER